MQENGYIKFWRNATQSSQELEVVINGVTLLIPPGVFNPSPQLTYSSSLLINHLPELKNKTVLDMGTGSGIISISALNKGAAFALATDIDKKALRTAMANAKRNNCSEKVTFIWSDLFQHFSGTYDYIFANLPIIDCDFKEIYNNLLNYYENYLNDNGELWVVYASFGDKVKADTFFDNHPHLKKKITETKFDIDWYLYQFRK